MIFFIRAFTLVSLYLLGTNLLIAQHTPEDSLSFRLIKKSTNKSYQLVFIQSDSIQLYVRPDSNGMVKLPADDFLDQVVKIDINGFRRASKQIKAKDLQKKPVVDINIFPNWLFDFSTNFNVSQQAFGRYWQSGGVNAISLGSRLNFGVNFKKAIVNWESEADITYGIIKQGENEFIKNQDQIILNSKFGLELTRKLNATLAPDLRTHIHDGYTINPDGSQGELFSGFLSPAFINCGLGIDFLPREGFSMFLAPLNIKITIVKDSTLRENYLPPDEATHSTRIETGSYLKVNYKKTFNDIVNLSSRLTLFSNYTNEINLDINSENTITCSLSKYIKAVLEVQLLYDEDIQFTIRDREGNPILDDTGQPQKGPRVQFREGLSLGFIYKI